MKAEANWKREIVWKPQRRLYYGDEIDVKIRV